MLGSPRKLRQSEFRRCRILREVRAQLMVPIPSPPIASRTIGEQLGDAGRKMGEALGQMGRTWGEGTGRAGERIGSWWYRSLGIAAPVVSGLIGVAALLVAMVIMGAIATVSEHGTFWSDLVSFIWQYFWLFVGLTFLNSFSSYFHRMHRRSWRWVSPAAAAVGSLAGFWILAQILEIMEMDLGFSGLGNLAEFIEFILPVIFVLVIVVGYMMVFFIAIGERGDELPRYYRYGRRRS